MRRFTVDGLHQSHNWTDKDPWVETSHWNIPPCYVIAQQRPHSIVTSLNLTKSFRLLTHMFKHESTVNETSVTILFLPCDGSVASLKGAGGGYNDSLNPFQLPPCMQPYNGVKVQRTSNISINVFPIACTSFTELPIIILNTVKHVYSR